ncbi:MAG: tyrosine--tRNA ligase [Candidatus Odinarchaeota archaeon]
MDVQSRIDLITRPPVEEIITIRELEEILETKTTPIAYDGFEPSGLAHIASGLMRALKIADLLKAGIKFKLLIADWHAWINEKMGGDLNLIQEVGKYIIKVWESLGVDTSKVEVIWASDLVKDPDYWKKVVLVMKNTTLKRMTRALTIMGRTEGELQSSAQFLYPAMQVSDIFQLGVDICQLGIDQRKANMLAREVAERFGWPKPVCVHHHMLMGLKGPTKMGGFDEEEELNLQIASKMSKSHPETCIYVHDPPEVIMNKILGAYCPEKQVKLNPVLDILKNIIFRGQSFKFLIERPSKFGGSIELYNFSELEKLYGDGRIHPLDLKKATAKYLADMLQPCREYFKQHPEYLDRLKTATAKF